LRDGYGNSVIRGHPDPEPDFPTNVTDVRRRVRH